MPQKHSAQLTNAKKRLSDHRIPFQSKKLLVLFIAIVVVLGGLIMYFSSAKTTITLIRTKFPIRATFVTELSSSANENQLQGNFETATVEHSYKTAELGEKLKSQGTSTGTIRVINNWNQVQPLQASTRFLTPDGVLFRSTERVDVPAGGEATVTVIADQKGASGDVPQDTHFTLPGLWAGLQEQIYGVNDSAFSGGEREVSVVSQKTIDTAQATALEELKHKAQAEIITDKTEGEAVYIIFNRLTLNQANASAGSEASELILSLRGEFYVLRIPESALYRHLYDKLQLKVTSDEELVEIDTKNLTIEIDRVSDDATAALRISVVGYAMYTNESTVFSPNTYTSFTESEIADYIEQEVGITSFRVRFNPPWATKTPSTSQRIRVIVQ